MKVYDYIKRQLQYIVVETALNCPLHQGARADSSSKVLRNLPRYAI